MRCVAVCLDGGEAYATVGVLQGVRCGDGFGACIDGGRVDGIEVVDFEGDI